MKSMALQMPTFPWFGGRLRCARLFKRPPLEVFLVALTDDISFQTLLAGGLHLVAFESLCLTGNTACE